MSNETREKLLAAIREKAYREGDFTLASGQRSDYYVDCKEVTLDADGSLLVGRAIYGLIKDWGVSSAGGMAAGSVPISTAVSLVSALEGKPIANFFVRNQAKDHGTGKRVEGKIGQGAKVVIVEDVVSTGGSSLRAIDAVREAGAEIIGLVSIVDREMGGAEAFEKEGIPYTPLFTISQIRQSKQRY